MTRTVVFDLDGTLVHSAPDIHAAANRMLADAGYGPLDLATVTGFIGKGIPHLVRLAMEELGIPGEREEDLRESMLSHYRSRPADLTRPYDGVVETLSALRDAGHALGVCTNKILAPSLEILETLDLMRFFGVVVAGDSLPVRKPDPAPVRAAFEALEGEPLAYVGDSATDAEAARRAGKHFALFTRGYRKEKVEELHHDFAFDDYGALQGHLLGAAR